MYERVWTFISHPPHRRVAAGVAPSTIARRRRNRGWRSSGLRERRPGVVARLGRQRVNLGRSHRVHPWPGVAAPGVEEGRLLGKVERVWQRVVGKGRVPYHRVGDVVEVAVAKRGGGYLRIDPVGSLIIPTQHPDSSLAAEGGFVYPSAHLPWGAEHIA